MTESLENRGLVNVLYVTHTVEAQKSSEASDRITRVISNSTLTTVMEYEDSPKFLDYPKRVRPQAVNKIFGKLMDDYSSEEDDKTVNWE